MIRITDGLVLTMDSQQPVLWPGAVVVEGNEIVGVGPADRMKTEFPEADEVRASGKLVMPGLVNAHTHLYRSLVREMPLRESPSSSFVDMMEKQWWSLAREMTLQDVSISAQAGLIEAVRSGITTLFDHHSSPEATAGSLHEIAKVTEEIGLRACLCYEISDRDGKAASKAALEENARFLRQWRSESNPLLRGIIGLHASFTVNNQTMERAFNLSEKFMVGFHLHAAEDNLDLQDSLLKYEKRVVQRLHDMGILGEWTLAAHGVHIDEHEMDILHNSRTVLVHNPRSNMCNAVGIAPVPQMLKRGVFVALGTDGFDQNIMGDFAVLPLVHRSAAKSAGAMALSQAIPILFQNNSLLVERIFGITSGKLVNGAAADLVMMNYCPQSPVTEENIGEHLFYGLAGKRSADSVMVNGRWILRDGEFVNVDEKRILSLARQASQQLWERCREEIANA